MIKEHLNKIRNAGFFLLVIAFVISTLWGSSHAFFPMLFSVILSTRGCGPLDQGIRRALLLRTDEYGGSDRGSRRTSSCDGSQIR